MSKKLEDLNDYIWTAIHDNYLIFIVVTSSAEGKNPSSGFDYGVGKSTWTLGLLKYIYNGDEELVKKNMCYFEEDIISVLQRPGKTMAIGLEDMQIVFGKERSHDNQVKQLANLLTGAREKVSIVIGNTPHLGKLASAWRELWMFEIKVYQRGFYEVQQVKHYTPFKEPTKVKSKLHYKGEASFDIPSQELEDWYKPWRADNYAEAVRRYSDRYMLIPEPETEPIPESDASKAGKLLVQIREQKRAEARAQGGK